LRRRPTELDPGRVRRQGPLRHQGDGARVPAGTGSENEVLERGAEPDVQLALERVDCTGAATAVGEEIDAVGPEPEQPRLRVVRTGRERGRARSEERRVGKECRSRW